MSPPTLPVSKVAFLSIYAPQKSVPAEYSVFIQHLRNALEPIPAHCGICLAGDFNLELYGHHGSLPHDEAALVDELWEVLHLKI